MPEWGRRQRRALWHAADARVRRADPRRTRHCYALQLASLFNQISQITLLMHKPVRSRSKVCQPDMQNGGRSALGWALCGSPPTTMQTQLGGQQHSKRMV